MDGRLRAINGSKPTVHRLPTLEVSAGESLKIRSLEARGGPAQETFETAKVSRRASPASATVTSARACEPLITAFRPFIDRSGTHIEVLDPRRFIRPSRGTLANVDLIARMSPMPGGTYTAVLSNGQQVQVSRIQARVLRETLLKL